VSAFKKKEAHLNFGENMHTNYEGMRMPDYWASLKSGRYFILAFFIFCCLCFTIYAFFMYEKSSVSVVLRSGSYIGETGAITPILKAEEIKEVVNTGVLNGLIAKKAKLEAEKISKLKAINPTGSEIVQVSLETEKESEGLIILHELVSQIQGYLEQRKTEKNKSITSKYFDSLKAQRAALELSKLKKTDELKSVVYEYAQLKKAIPPPQERLKIEEQIRGKGEVVKQKQRELGNIDLDLANLQKQTANLSDFVGQEKTIQIIQEPLVTSMHFMRRFLNHLFVVAVISMAFGIILQFIIYDLKLEKRIIKK